MPPAHLERRDGSSIRQAKRIANLSHIKAGLLILLFVCHTYAAMRNRGNKQKAYVQASFLLSRRDDHNECGGARLAARGHQARRTWRIIADGELCALPWRRPHRR